jgi:hypothetical protein
MDGGRIRANAGPLAMEMLAVWCYLGIGVLAGLFGAAMLLDLVETLYVPLGLAMLCLALGTLAGGIGWFLVGESIVGGFVAGLRVLTVVALLYVAGNAFDAGMNCSGDCAYTGQGLEGPLFVLYLVSPLVSSAALLLYVLRGERGAARGTLAHGP